MKRIVFLVVIQMFTSLNVFSSGIAPNVSECETVKVVKVKERFIPWRSTGKEACRFNGEIVKNFTGKKQVLEFFVFKKEGFLGWLRRFLFDECPSEGEVFKGDITWYYGNPDGGIGMERDPDFPLFTVRSDCE